MKALLEIKKEREQLTHCLNSSCFPSVNPICICDKCKNRSKKTERKCSCEQCSIAQKFQEAIRFSKCPELNLKKLPDKAPCTCSTINLTPKNSSCNKVTVKCPKKEVRTKFCLEVTSKAEDNSNKCCTIQIQDTNKNIKNCHSHELPCKNKEKCTCRVCKSIEKNSNEMTRAMPSTSSCCNWNRKNIQNSSLCSHTCTPVKSFDDKPTRERSSLKNMEERIQPNLDLDTKCSCEICKAIKTYTRSSVQPLFEQPSIPFDLKPVGKHCSCKPKDDKLEEICRDNKSKQAPVTDHCSCKDYLKSLLAIKKTKSVDVEMKHPLRLENARKKAINDIDIAEEQFRCVSESSECTEKLSEKANSLNLRCGAAFAKEKLKSLFKEQDVFKKPNKHKRKKRASSSDSRAETKKTAVIQGIVSQGHLKLSNLSIFFHYL